MVDTNTLYVIAGTAAAVSSLWAAYELGGAAYTLYQKGLQEDGRISQEGESLDRLMGGVPEEQRPQVVAVLQGLRATGDNMPYHLGRLTDTDQQ